jgi:hypothetical protein
MQKATLAQIAVQGVSWATVEIQRLEATPGELDGEKLKTLYALREDKIREAMEHGATAAELSAITGNPVR